MNRSALLQSRHVLGLWVLLLLGCSWMPSQWAKLMWDRPRHLLLAATRPLVQPLHRFGNALRRPASLETFVDDETQLRTQYQRALQYARRLEDELHEARTQIMQLSQVRQHLDLSGIQLVPASVVGSTSGRAHPTLVIRPLNHRRSRHHRLEEGMVVAHGFNLVGRVGSVGPVTAVVGLIHQLGRELVVRVVPPVPGAPPRELVTSLRPHDPTRFVAEIDIDDPVQTGDLVHLSDPAWPAEARGLVVGRVTAIEKDPDDPLLRRLAIVSPIQSLSHLDRVVVLVPTGQTP